MIYPEDYCALIFRAPDRLRVVNAHDEVIKVISDALENFQLDFSFYYKSEATCAFKFKGSSPFAAAGCGQETTIKHKRALASILENLQKISWHIVISTDLAKQRTNSCIFLRKIVVFDQVKIKKLTRDGKIFTFSPSGSSGILLIDVPVDIERELVTMVETTCKVDNYQILDSVDSVIRTSKLTLKGWSWAATGDNAINMRKMILKAIQIARNHKFELVTNVNLKGTTDSLMFQHKVSLQSGAEDMFAMSLNRNDRLRLICAPSYIVTASEEVLSQHWGIQVE